MAIDTKPNLNSDKFEQYSGDTLNLSGNTNIFKNITIKSGGTLTILGNHGLGKVITSDVNGIGTWQVASSSSGGITGATNGLTKSGSNVVLGGTLTGNTSFDGNYSITFGDNTSLSDFSVNTTNGFDVGVDNVGSFYMQTGATNSIILSDIRIGIEQVGIEYLDDYSANFTARSLVDRGYVDSIVSGGSGTVIISKTYLQLQTLVSTSGLTQGQQYLLSDYQTKHLIPNSNPNVIHTGNTEPLILTAVNAFEFDSVVKSIVYPMDIINYRFDDDSCEDGTRDIALQKWVGGTPRNGYITYRKSTTNNLSTYYDWRNYKVRRWKVDAIAWSGSTSYIKMDVIKSPSDSNIYVAKTTQSSGTTDPSTDTVNWQLWLDLTIQNSGAFLSFTPNASNFYLGGILTTNLIINNIIQGTDYDDYYTFCILGEPTNSSGLVETNTNGGIIGEGFNNFEIGKFDYDYFNYEYGSGTDLESNVFYLQPNGNNEYYVRDNKFGSNTTYNTIGNDFYYNTIGNYFNYNTIGNSFNYNTIGNYFYYNTIGNYFKSNTIGNDFYSNTIGNGFQYNETKNTVSNINWLNAIPTPTHVYATYNKTIFMNSSSVLRLSYYDGSDQLIITDITS